MQKREIVSNAVEKFTVFQTSICGKHHIQMAQENQDAMCHTEKDGFAVICLADGVSACRMSAEGARIAVTRTVEMLTDNGAYFIDCEDRFFVENVLSHVRSALWAAAEKDRKLPKAFDGSAGKTEQNSLPTDLRTLEYSSTLSAVMVNSERGILRLMNLGDNLVLAVGVNGPEILTALPDSQQACLTTTTQKAEQGVTMKRIRTEGLRYVLICSDGAWRQMFCRGKFREDVRAMLSMGEWTALTSLLRKTNPSDDCSFIAMNVAGGLCPE